MRWRAVALAFLSAAPCCFAPAAGADPLVRQVRFVSGGDHFPDASAGALTLILDREEYDPLDTTGVAVVLLKAAPPADARVNLELIDAAGKVAQRQEIAPLEGRFLDVTLNTQGIPLGRFTLRATLADRDGRARAASEAPLRKKVRRAQIAPPARRQVALNVWPTASSGVQTWPISTGVPFPQGALLDENHVRLLDEAGAEVPCQTAVRSLWTREGSVQWLGLDFQGALKPDGAKYRLEFGTEVRRAAAPSPLKVADSTEGIAVDTGRLRFTVRKQGFNLLDSVLVDGRPVSRQGKEDGLVVVDHEGAVYRASNDPATTVAVEESGPLRVTIRAEGGYVKDGTQGRTVSPTLPTDSLCRHVTRITAHAGQPYVTVKHDLVVTFDTHRVRLKNVGIGQRLDGAPEGASFGLDGKSVDVAPLPSSARLYQASSEDGQVETADAVVRAGRRADGWARLGGAAAGMTMCVTDLWQLFPKEVEVAGGSLRLHVWPRHGRPVTKVDPLDLGEIYKLWWCHSGAELSFAMPGDAYGALKKTPLYAEKEGHSHIESGRVSNAQGVAIENNFLLAFDAGRAGPVDAPALNAVSQSAPHAWADPEWVCDSLAFGWQTPRDERAFHSAEKFFEHAWFARQAAQEFARDYGQFNYGDIHSDNSEFINGRWGLGRVWNQGHHGTHRIPWTFYARSGDPRWLRAARRGARHVMNVDVTHYVTPDYDLLQGFADVRNVGHRKGAMFHAKGFTHWGGDCNIVSHLINFDFILWDYYVTGNRRALEVVQEWTDAVQRENPPAGTGREATQPIADLTEAYKRDFDPRVLLVLRKLADRVAGRPFFEKDQHNVQYAPFVERYLTFTGSESMRRRAREYADTIVKTKPNWAAALYYETGEVSYLKEALQNAYFGSLRWDPRPLQITDRTRLSAYHKVSLELQFIPPFLRAIKDAGLPFAMTPQAAQPAPGGGETHTRQGKEGEESVVVLKAGVQGQFVNSRQAWYFRAVPGQKTLKVRIATRARECGVQIATADGKEILAQRGIVNDESTVSLDLKPGEAYVLITAQVGSTPNVIVPEGAPLVLSRTPGEWFMPELK